MSTDHKDYEHFVSGVEAQCCFTSTETIRTMSVVSGVLDLDLYIAGIIFAMVLKLIVALRPQRP